jgi:predicted DNA-binding transcriptional regulator AlpA
MKDSRAEASGHCEPCISEAEYINTADLEALTGVSRSTWAKRRLRGDTPPYIKLGRSVRYHLPTAKDWLAGRVRHSTSDTGEK